MGKAYGMTDSMQYHIFGLLRRRFRQIRALRIDFYTSRITVACGRSNEHERIEIFVAIHRFERFGDDVDDTVPSSS